MNDIPTTPEPTIANARKLLEAGRKTLLLALANESEENRRMQAPAFDVLEHAGALDKLISHLGHMHP